MHNLPNTDPECGFYIRVPAGDGEGYYYDHVSISNMHGSGRLALPHPPLVGDLILLHDQIKKVSGTYRVIARSWMHSSYGSVNWPYNEPRPQTGPLLDIIVEPSDGPFINQVLRPEDEGE